MGMGVRRLAALCCLVLLARVQGSSHHLSGPLLCSACEVTAAEISKKMEADADRSDTVLVGHRLNKDNKPKRQQYKGSELAAFEMLDGLCNEMTLYSLRQDAATHKRLFTTNTSIPTVSYYSEEERELLKNAASKDLAWSCNVFIDEQNEEIVDLIKAGAPDAVASQLCNKTTNVCTEKYLSKYVAKEAKARGKWLKEQNKRRKKAEKERAREEKEREEKQKREEEEAKKKAEEGGGEANAEVQEGTPEVAGTTVPWSSEDNASAGENRDTEGAGTQEKKDEL